MKLKTHEITDVYRRFMNFVYARYPLAIVKETNTSTIIATNYGEPRVFMTPNDDFSGINVRLLYVAGEKITNSNSLMIPLTSLYEIACVKNALILSMDMRSSSGKVNNEFPSINFEINNDTNVYLADKEGVVLGVVNMDNIPKEAVVSGCEYVIRNAKEPKIKNDIMNDFFKR